MTWALRLAWMTAGCVFSLAFSATAASAQEEPASSPPAQQADDEARMMAAAKVIQRSLDAVRARNFKRWLACFSPDVIVRSPQMHINNRAELKAIYEFFFKEDSAILAVPEILESGWTGERVFVRAKEQLGEGGPFLTTYAEYEVENGQITAVYSQIE
ncbi:MAG: nuclear transport factor 2 family protein [Pseudomonadota bacterium]